MNKKFYLSSILVLIMVLTISSISALGVTPGRQIIDYEPGSVKEVSFKILNSDNEDLNLIVSSRGDLKSDIRLNEKEISISSDEASKEVSYTINMSKGMKPGQHTGEVMILQIPEEREEQGAYVGASLAVITQIRFHVPYPGRYAEAELGVSSGGKGEEVKFYLPITNRGKFDLVNVRAVLDIYNPLNEKIESIQTPGIDLASGKSNELKTEWLADVNPGKYKVIANIIYGQENGDTIELEETFNIGDQTLQLQSIEVNNFNLGEIAKIEMLVENKWSEDAKDAYILTEIFSDNELMSQFKSASQDVPSLSKSVLTAYWDTAGVSQGTYDTKVHIKHNKESQEENIKLEVKEHEINAIGLGYVISERESSSDNSLIIILVVLVIILMIVNIWFLFLRKKLLGKN